MKKIKIRRSDKYGDGAYMARRRSGANVRAHNGIDITAEYGTPVYALCNGTYVRQNRPYANDTSYVGLTMTDDTKHTIKYFYVTPCISPGVIVMAGDLIGYAQNIAAKYSGITNHYHFEIWENGKTLNPTEYLVGFDFI